jgi:hypothetical protein
MLKSCCLNLKIYKNTEGPIFSYKNLFFYQKRPKFVPNKTKYYEKTYLSFDAIIAPRTRFY